MIKSINHIVFKCTNLEESRRFYEDFGMKIAHDTGDRLYFRGTESKPYIFVLEQADQFSLNSVGYEVRSEQDLKIFAERFNAPISASESPWGGQRVQTQDCDGNQVELLWGIQQVEPLGLPREAIQWNFGGVRGRFGRFPVLKDEPVPILHLCHIVHTSPDPGRLVDWYVKNLGAYTSDVIEKPDSSPVIVFMRFPNGKEYVDHHSLAVSIGETGGVNHVCFETLDADAIFSGNKYLKRRGYRQAWGPLRHTIGGALSDYWVDPSGLVVEHVTDSDVINDDFPTAKTPIGERAVMQWGPPMPEEFLE